MDRLGSTLAMAALLFSVDASGILGSPIPAPHVTISAADGPQAGQASQQAPEKDQSGPSDSPDKSGHSQKAQSGKLQDSSRLALVRNVDGEMVRVVQSIPAGKKGFHLKAGDDTDQKFLHMAVASTGAAINPGDRAQITSLDFKEKQIIVDINGGGKGKTHFRDHIHLEVGGAYPTMTTTSSQAAANVPPGATIYLDFDKPVPDLTPEQLEKYLSPLLDFSKRHSASVQWVDTLPPEIQKAIEEKQPAVGMDRDMVLAALGKPDRKVREKGPDGAEVEDWIYGTPPEKTIFVSFEGDKVTKVDQYPK